MKQIKNKFGILGESHGQDRKHKEEITIFKNPAENQQRNKENNILEVLGQALRKQKTCRKQKKTELFLESPPIPRPGKNQKKNKRTKKKQYFRTLSGDTPNSKTWKKPKKNKRTKKNNISELFLESPQIPRPGKKQKKTKELKKTIFQNSFWRHPKFQDLWKIVFFWFFFCFFWFSAGFCQEA